MKKINFKRYISLVGLYFIANLLSEYFINDDIELVAIILGTIVFAVFIFIAETLSRKDVKR